MLFGTTADFGRPPNSSTPTKLLVFRFHFSFGFYSTYKLHFASPKTTQITETCGIKAFGLRTRIEWCQDKCKYLYLFFIHLHCKLKCHRNRIWWKLITSSVAFSTFGLSFFIKNTNEEAVKLKEDVKKKIFRCNRKMKSIHGYTRSN